MMKRLFRAIRRRFHLIDDWRRAWQFDTLWFTGLCAFLTPVWAGLTPEQQKRVLDATLGKLGLDEVWQGVLLAFVAAFLLRFRKTKPDTPANNDQNPS